MVQRVIVDGNAWPLADGGVIQRRTLLQLPPKNLVGTDPRLEDDTIRSTYAFSLWEGLGRRKARENEEGIGRIWVSAGVDTRFHGFMTLCPNAREQSLAAGMQVAATRAMMVHLPQLAAPYVVVANKMQPADLGALTANGGGFSSAGAVTTLPANLVDFCSFGGQTYFIYGAGSNYTYGYTALSPGSQPLTTIAPLAGALYGTVGAAGSVVLWYSTNPANAVIGNWTKLFPGNAGDGILLDLADGETPLKLVAGWSGNGLPCLYMLTNLNVWQIDVYGPAMTRVYQLPAVATATNADMLRWDRTGNIYVSLPKDIIEIAPGVIRHIGPFKDDGLPTASDEAAITPALDGTILSLFQMENWLGCIIAKGVGTGVGSILAWDQVGWHNLNRSTNSAAFPLGRGAHANGALFYPTTNGATTNGVVAMYLPDSPQPTWQYDSTDINYRASGTLYTPWLDRDLPALNKVADEWQVLGRFLSVNEKVTIGYQTSDGTTISPSTTTFSTLGATAATPAEGLQKLPFSVPTTWKKIRFSIRLDRGGDSTKAPLIEVQGLKFLVRPQALWSWNFTVDCNFADTFEGRTAGQIRDLVIAAAEKVGSVTFSYDRLTPTRNVYVSGCGGNETVGDGTPGTPASRFTVTLVESLSQVG